MDLRKVTYISSTFLDLRLLHLAPNIFYCFSNQGAELFFFLLMRKTNPP
jgi:hypothetical protein